MPKSVSIPYRFGRFELNPATRRLLADGEPLALGARAFDVLVALIERRERLVGKDELLEVVWPGLVVEENNLQVQISALRKALGSQTISTVPGRGYRFVAPLDGEAPASVERALVETAAPSAGVGSIAVLPFTNMSDDNAMAYFADGVQDDLLTQLALMGGLRVVSRTSVAAYRNTNKNVRQIAAELGVASLVEGSVRRSGDRVRVSAQLIDARSDTHLWVNSYDRELKDIFAIQSELATAIAKALKVSLSPSEQARLARKPTESLDAYDMVLQHRDLWLRSAAISAEHRLEERIALLSRAVALDPKYAVAWARLGAEHARVRFYWVDGSAARLAQARQAIDRALALAPEDIAVRNEIGNFYYYGLHDFARAALYLEDLLRIAPNNVDTLTELAWVRRRQGLWAESNRLLERALAVDARNLVALQSLRENFARFRHWPEAAVLQGKIAAVLPDSLDEQCRLHEMEWSTTGSFARYDAWRKSVPDDAAQDSWAIWYMDVRRAAVGQDVAVALRMVDAGPREQDRPTHFQNERRATFLLAKGARPRALALAQASLRSVQTALERNPDDRLNRQRASWNLGLLGEPAAWSDYERCRAATIALPDAIESARLDEFEIVVQDLLGDREKALQSLERLLKKQGLFLASDWRLELSFASLWPDPRFQALANDPANNAPLPIVDWDFRENRR